MDEKHELQQMVDCLCKRDAYQVDGINGMFGGGSTIENRLELANGRATDALAAIFTLRRPRRLTGL